MRTLEEIKQGIADLEADLSKVKEAQARVKLTEKTDRLTQAANEIAHAVKSKAYIDFMESKAYIDGLQAEIANTGTVATIPYSGKLAQVKLSPDHKSLTTFDMLSEGSTIVISDSNYLIARFSHTYAGSYAELIPLSAKVFISGEPVTPYSGIPAHYNAATKRLTLSKFNRLQKGATLTINGQLFAPVALVGDCSTYFTYELEGI